MKTVSLLILFLAAAFAANNNIHAETDTYVVDVTGNQNVPKYTFYLKSNTSNTYKVQFDHLYECVPSKLNCTTKNGNSEIALASLKWSFTEPTEIDGEIAFNITAIGGNKMRFTKLEFVNHIKAAATSIKIDVILNGYQWVSGNDSKLILGYAVHGDNNLIFDVAPTATASISGPVNVTLSSHGNIRETTYEHFLGDLVHDPTIGIAASSQSLSPSANESDSQNETSSASLIAPVWAFLAVVFVAMF